MVKEYQTKPFEERQAFISNPQKYINEELGDQQRSETLEKVFVETPEFISQRIEVIGVWEPKLCAYKVERAGDWMPENCATISHSFLLPSAEACTVRTFLHNPFRAIAPRSVHSSRRVRKRFNAK